MLTFSTEKKQSPATKPHHNSMSGTSRPQHHQVRHILRGASVQPKLSISKPSDKFEQEADRVADQVMRMPEPQVQRQSEEGEEELQLKAGPTTAKPATLGDKGVASSSLESSVRSIRAGGRELNEQERGFFEPRMGANFSNVRLHSEPEAANAATAIGARAFAVGNHIAVAKGEYNFHSPQGKQLMAHELVHVMQNGGEEVVWRNPLAVMGAAEWIAAAALGITVANEAVKNSSGDITWKLDEASGVLLPGGRTDVEEYQRENPDITIEQKELVVTFWKGTEGSKKAGITFGLTFSTDGKGIGDISSRIIDTHDWVGWEANCTVDLMPLTFVSENGKAVVRVTLTNSWIINIVGFDVSDGVDSEIWHLEGDGSFTKFRGVPGMWVEHRLT